jgi:hypothetical protein
MDHHCIEAVNRGIVIFCAHIASQVQGLRKSDSFADLPELSRLHIKKGKLIDVNKYNLVMTIVHFQKAHDWSLLPLCTTMICFHLHAPLD